MAKAQFYVPTNYTADPTTGKPLTGNLYFGQADLDGEILANRVTIFIVQESGVEVVIQPASQPLQCIAGVIIYQGSPVVVLIDGVYSLKVTDTLGAQVYYAPRLNEIAAISVEGALPVNGSFENETQTSGTPDNWTIVEGSNGTIITDTDSAHGLKALKFTGTDVTGAGVATSDLFDVLDSGYTTTSFVYKSSAVDTLNKIEINWYNSALSLISTSTLLNEGANNPLVYTSFKTNVLAPTGAVRAEIVITGMDGAGTTNNGVTSFDNILYLGTDEVSSNRSGITADPSNIQGGSPLVAIVNEVSVGGVGDSVTLPPAKPGLTVLVTNNTGNIIALFPDVGDDLGQGLNSQYLFGAAEVAFCIAYDETNWVLTLLTRPP